MTRFILQQILKYYARKIIAVYKPLVIGITGSVGKTSTKEAVARVLSHHFRVRETYKNYNNELGLPLTIIGQHSAGRSLGAWLRVFAYARSIIKNKISDYPELLVLEMGVDHPGDMDYLTSIVKPDRAIITKLGQAHLEFFKSLEHLHNEKFKLAQCLNTDGLALYNGDDENARRLAEKLKHSSISFGYGEKCDVKAENIAISFSNDEVSGISFKLEYKGSSVPVFLPGAIGRPAVYAALAAAAIGFSFEMNALEISESLREFKQPAGRLQLIKGISNSLIIDDTYNSSPDSVFEAIKASEEIPNEYKKRFWVVLGSMKELGSLSKKGHHDVALAAEQIADIIVAVGEEAKTIFETIAEKKTKQVYWFEDSVQAGEFIKDKINDGDLLLIKGSQFARMEKIVKMLMLIPEKANELLVRQGKGWE